ncbi:DUF418 domain-containing protein [Spirosoma harenae]
MVSSFDGSDKRVHNLDVVRGIAMLGMLIVDSQTCSLFAFFSPQQVYQLQLDQSEMYMPVQFFIHLFVKGPFELIYSFLFGIWFYKRWESDKQAGFDPSRLAQHRLGFLLILGLLHGFAFWFGDILLQYAILGFSLLYFIKRSVRSLGRWIAGFVLLAILLQGLIQSAGDIDILNSDQQTGKALSRLMTAWQRGSIWEVMHEQAGVLSTRYHLLLRQGLSSWILHEIMLIVGLIAGKLGLPYRMARLKVRFSLLLLFFFPAAFLIKGFSVLLEFGLVMLPEVGQPYQPLLVSLSTFIGTLLLTLVYLLEMGLHIRLYSSNWTVWIGRVGQMGLSNYLLQSLLCSILFYGYGLGLAGHLTLLESLVPIPGIYILQIIFSNIWLSYYQLGPIEYLWQRLIHGKLVPSNQTAIVRP